MGNSVRMGESPKIAGGYLYLPISFPVLPCSYGIKTCVLFFFFPVLFALSLEQLLVPERPSTRPSGAE